MLLKRRQPVAPTAAPKHCPILTQYGLCTEFGIAPKGTQNLPIFLPTLHAGGVLATPFFSKLEKRILCLIQGDRGVDFFQDSRHLFDILPTDVSGGGANLMDDAALEMAVGIHGLDGLHHAAQTVRAK